MLEHSKQVRAKMMRAARRGSTMLRSVTALHKGDPKQKASDAVKQKQAAEERKRRAEFAFVDRGEEFFWIKDSKEAFRPAKVVDKRKDGGMTVEYTGGTRTTKTVSKDDVGPRISRPESLRVEFEDMVRMEDVNVATILHNLRMRFKADRIYTNIGKMLFQGDIFVVR